MERQRSSASEFLYGTAPGFAPVGENKAILFGGFGSMGVGADTWEYVGP